MAQEKYTVTIEQVKELLQQDGEFLRPATQQVAQEVLESEMDTLLGAGRYERAPTRTGYRSGSYPRTLITRVGALELRVPQDIYINYVFSTGHTFYSDSP
ncbi:MAG: transposase, partial [Armatimonadota bacterium]